MKLKKYLFIILIFPPIIVLAQTTSPSTHSASPMLNRLKNVGTGAGYATATETSIAEIVGTIINGFLVLLGTVFIILILLAGYNWMTARGDEEKINKAKDTIRAAIVGLIIVVGAFAIWMFVSNYLIGGTTGQSGTSGGG